MIVFLNGKWVPEKKATISISDHGFLYGDGVYETIRVYNGKPFLLSEHLRRLNNSMLGIRLSTPMSLMQIGFAIRKTIEMNKHKEAVVRLTITRGLGEYGFDPATCTKPTIVITSKPVAPYPATFYKKGILAAVVSVRRNAPEALSPSIKSTSCLNGILAKIESLDLAAQEGIMLGSDRCLTEGSVSNVFLVKQNHVMTPRLDDGLLAGVTRDWVCRLVKDAGYVLQEKKLGVSDLASADEIFLTSTIMEIMPVSRVVLNYDQHRRQFRLGPYAKTSGTVGPVVLDLMHRFRESIGRFSRL
jgi:branched-chain amino acid aminotransferase